MKTTYQFGPFRLDPAERRLVRDGTPVPLTPKAFDLLVLLVENAGHLMKKSDLLEALWPGVFVEEVNLAQNVSAIRRALGGDDRQSHIQTVAGVGYRFTASVQTSDASARDEKRQRLIVLPLRMLKPDEDTNFLSFSLPDALTASLSNLDSIIVRSSLVSARFTQYPIDLRKVAESAQVDLVLSGTLVRVGNQLRVCVELADAAAGTVMWSHVEHAALGDLFKLQDSLVDRIIRLLELRLTVREQERLRCDAPTNAQAYEFYLRANQIVSTSRGYTNVQTWHIARDLYLQSLSDAAGFAPAWAALGRVYRMLAKYTEEDSAENFQRAESAIAKALELNPDQPMAQMLRAQLDTDAGRGRDAVVRLLKRARLSPRDAEPFAGLCYACRYCGLLDESLAADRRARSLDSAIVTSAVHTHFVMGDDPRVVELLERAPGGYGYVGLIALMRIGRTTDALDAANRVDRTVPATFRAFVGSVRSLIEGRNAESADALDEVLWGMHDPEAYFYAARQYSYLGEPQRALDALDNAVRTGYYGLWRGQHDRWFDPIRDDPAFARLVDLSRTGHDDARAAFRGADGDAVLDL
ncbi:MAG TPA: winged helix-turn-helix domain-containing protein [Vicinamibacterales bacterium]|nr:winged helix-turn-helix domain-containing protein [Vicinamibacterales bacterium]